MRKILVISFMFFLALVALFAGLGTMAWISQVVAFTPKQETFNQVPLIHNKDVIIQQQGVNVIIKNAGISDVGYTGSMIPTIYGGNKAIIRPYPYYRIKQNGTCKDIKEGQIAAYVNKEVIGFPLIVHRVIDNNISDGMIRFKGDNNKSSEFISCESIKYLVIGIIYE